MQPLRQLRARVESAVSGAQARALACAAPGPPTEAAAAPHDVVVRATRTFCSRSKAQLQLDALQTLSEQLAHMPDVLDEAPAATLQRVKAHIEHNGGSVLAERDRLQAAHEAQLHAMAEAVLADDKQRLLGVAVATGTAVVNCVTKLERLRAAAAALMSVADEALHAGDDAALRAFIGNAYAPQTVTSKCVHLLADVVASLRDGFGDAAGLEAVTAALHGDTSATEHQEIPTSAAEAPKTPEEERAPNAVRRSPWRCAALSAPVPRAGPDASAPSADPAFVVLQHRLRGTRMQAPSAAQGRGDPDGAAQLALHTARCATTSAHDDAATEDVTPALTRRAPPPVAAIVHARNEPTSEADATSDCNVPEDDFEVAGSSAACLHEPTSGSKRRAVRRKPAGGRSRMSSCTFCACAMRQQRPVRRTTLLHACGALWRLGLGVVSQDAARLPSAILKQRLCHVAGAGSSMAP